MKRTTILLSCLLAVTSVFARQISRQEAFEKAQQFMQGKQLLHGNQSRIPGQLKAESLQPTQSFRNFYIFNAESNGGFVIVSADDRTQGILGYANCGEIDIQKMPCQMQWLLNYYEVAIAQLSPDDTNDTGHNVTRSSDSKPNIVPLIDTQWSQGEPYNALCPTHQGSGSKCVTGCVATAMAQVINYYRWPQAATASVSAYTTMTHGFMMPALPAKQFDWNNMGNTSIAQLMLYCGQSVHMDYDPAASGAFTSEMPTALINVFGYSKSATLAGRGSYSDEQWEQMVYDELQQGHPILYSGQSPDAGGHAFIIDGYADGLYHLNWGWGGYCDGYFTLDKLNPNMDNGFNYSQEMILNACPPADAGDISRPKAIVTGITCSERYLERTASDIAFPAFTVTSTVESDLASEATLQIGLALYDDNGLVKVLAQETRGFSPSDSYTMEAQVTLDANLPQGEYRIVAINRSGDTEGWLANLGGTTRYVAVSIAETSLQLQPMPKSEDGQWVIDFGVHTIDGITYNLVSEYDNLRATILPYNETGRYKGDIYVPNNVSYQNMVFNVWHNNHYPIDKDYSSLNNSSFSYSPELTMLSTPVSLSVNSCSQLANIELREGITSFYAIAGCPLLKTITYPSTCNHIVAPRDCDNLNSITILNTHKVEINFYWNTCWSKESTPALKDIYFSGGIPPSITGEIPQVNTDITIHIPLGTMEIYKRSNWKEWNLVEDQPIVPINVTLDYCGNDDEAPQNLDGMGVGVFGGDNYNVEFAMRIPTSHLDTYKNCQITAIEYYTPSPFANDCHYEDAEYVFITTPGMDYLTKQSAKTVRGTWTKVELSQPYTITGEELFVGIGRSQMLQIWWANYDFIENGFWARTVDKAGTPKVWDKPDYHYPFPIRAIIEGDNLPTDVVIACAELIESSTVQQMRENCIAKTAPIATKIADVKNENKYLVCVKENNAIHYTSQSTIAQSPQKISSDKKQVRLKVRNHTPRLVKQITVDWDIDGIEQKPYIIETALLTNQDEVVYVDLPNNLQGRTHTINFNVSEIDGEPDAIQANSNIEVSFSMPATTYFPRKIVMEEATGTWCGWCPRGIVAIKDMTERYPDNFIAIAIHDDVMTPTEGYYNPFYSMVSGVPTSRINRSYWYDPWPFDIEEMKDQGIAMIKANAEFSLINQVEINTETTFGFDDNGSAEYRIAYVVVEDNVGPYMQANYYSNTVVSDDPNGLLDWWVHQGAYVETMYNDVARAIYDYDGVVGLLPKKIVEGETYQSKFTLTLPDNIQNVENLKVITLLIDSRTGEILNADCTTIAGEYDVTSILIDETNFPDESFRSYLLAQDYGQDGILTEAEIESITKVDVSGRNISKLNGIEHFSALRVLWCCDNQLTTLNITENAALTDLRCNNNLLRSLNTMKNTVLTYLDCGKNRLTALDISKNTALTELDCANNLLTVLDVSANQKLTSVNCSRNQIEGSAMDALITSLPQTNSANLRVYDDTKADESNVCTKSQAAAAKTKGWTPCYTVDGVIWIEYEGSEETPTGIAIDKTNFPDENFRNWLLGQNYGKDGILTEEEISGIASIDISVQNINSLTGIEHFTALTRLNCYYNPLTVLDLSQNTALTWLECSFNQLTALDVSGCTALDSLFCFGNQLTTLDVSQNTALKNLWCYGNQLTALDVSKNTALTDLECSGNQLTTLDVSGHTALRFLECSGNQLTALDVSGCTALYWVLCYDNQIQGASMDAFISSLPQNDNTYFYYLYLYKDTDTDPEGNECTKKQVEAAKAKGWIPYYYDSISRNWEKYEGYDDESTRITQPTTAIMEVGAPVYTLSGQKVNGSLKGKKGVYIVGGKKVVVK